MQEYVAKVDSALRHDVRTKMLAVQVFWDGSAIVIDGLVSLFYHKQLVQTVAMQVGPVTIVNKVQVKRRTGLF